MRGAAALGAAVLALSALAGGPAAALDFDGMRDKQREKLSAAEQTFQESETLKLLKERSEANKAKNKKEIQNKYCARQAELGVGDCGGLRYIPGMTQNGKQKTPDWLNKVLGVEARPDPAGGKTLADLLKVE